MILFSAELPCLAHEGEEATLRWRYLSSNRDVKQWCRKEGEIFRGDKPKMRKE